MDREIANRLLAQCLARPDHRGTFILSDILGGRYERQATVLGLCEQHGWLTPGGGWTSIEQIGDRPAFRISYRKRRGRNRMFCRLESVVDIWSGWGRKPQDQQHLQPPAPEPGLEEPEDARDAPAIDQGV